MQEKTILYMHLKLLKFCQLVMLICNLFKIIFLLRSCMILVKKQIIYTKQNQLNISMIEC